MVAAPQPRKYDPRTDKAWSREVSKAVRRFLIAFPEETRKPSAAYGEICGRFKDKHAALCDDRIRHHSQLGPPYWKHTVANALQTLKKAGKVSRSVSGEWVWTGGTVPPSRPRPVQPPTPAPSPGPTGATPQPTPILVEADVRKQLRDRLFQLSPDQFERLVGRLLESLGVSNVQVTGRTGDGGLDGHGIAPVLSLRVCFQAKRWTNPVPGEPVRALIGTVVNNAYDKGVFITTSSFTAGAKEESERSTSRVVLLDGDAVVDLMMKKHLGVRSEPVVREVVDEEFFGNLAG